MKNILSKTMYMGMGIAAMTKERIDKFAKDVVEYTDMTEEQGRKFAEYLNEESEKSKEDMQKAIDNQVNRAIDKLPGMKRVKDLEARVADLESQIKKHKTNHKKTTAETEGESSKG